MTALATRGLTKRYGDLTVVDGLDLRVERGELYGFLGPNGSGKTTTIRMLLGLTASSDGEVEVLGEPVPAHATPAALRRVGALIEEPAFYRYLSGRTNLEYFARAAGPAEDRRRRLAEIDTALDRVGLAAAAGKKVKAYSQGMRQRLGLARALLGGPEVLVLDEPTNGLDPQGMREVRRLLRTLVDAGTTVFVSSHLLSEVEAMCDRVGVLARGRLVAEGPPSSLRSAGGTLRVAVDDRPGALAALERLPGVAAVAGPDGLRLVVTPPATAAQANAALVHAGVAVSSLVPEQERLEDVFLALTEDADAPR